MIMVVSFGVTCMPSVVFVKLALLADLMESMPWRMKETPLLSLDKVRVSCLLDSLADDVRIVSPSKLGIWQVAS